jgi:hypothetical protein
MSSSKASCKKDEEKELEPKRTPMILMLSIGQQKLAKKASSRGKPNGV